MDIRTLPRNAVTGYVTLARKPIDLAWKVTGHDEPLLLVDRIDAAVRDAAANLLDDDVLREDARRRQVAVDQRLKARALRDGAEQRAAEAEAQAEERHRIAGEQRQQAAEAAAARQADIERKRVADEKKAATAAARKKQAVRQAAQQAEEAVRATERQARLHALEVEGEAIQEEEEALAAKAEAERLGRAARAAKTSRKKS